MGQVYWEKKRRRIVAQLAQPSKWDETKYNGSALKRALADTILVDAAWLAQLADKGGLLPRCQEVPTDFVVTLEEMERSNFCFGELLPVLVISSPWLNADHPDEHGVLLQSVKFVLNAFAKRAESEGGKCGVFWDYCSLPQRRLHAFDHLSSTETETFDRAILGVSSWFGHPLTTVLLVDTPPPKRRTPGALEATLKTHGAKVAFKQVFDTAIDKSDEGLAKAFKKVDADSSGNVSAAEMSAHIASVYGAMDESITTEMLKAADTDGDGEVSLDEFKTIMRAGPDVKP
jgi:hypothetical protein